MANEQTAVAKNARKAWTLDQKIQAVSAFASVIGLLLVAITIVIANRTMEIENRAWVDLVRLALDREPIDATPATIGMIQVTKGNSPARNLTLRTVWNVGPQPSDQPLEPLIAQNLSGGPDNAVSFPDSNYKREILLKMDAEEVELYKAGAKIWVRSIVSYEDVFGRKHWMKACSFHDRTMPLDQFLSCHSGNEIDP